MPGEPWALLVRALYSTMGRQAVVYTAATGGRWLTPAAALYPDDAVHRDPLLMRALLSDALPLADCPPTNCAMLHQLTVSCCPTRRMKRSEAQTRTGTGCTDRTNHNTVGVWVACGLRPIQASVFASQPRSELHIPLVIGEPWVTCSDERLDRDTDTRR